MDQLRPKTGNQLPLFYNYNNMSLNLHFLVVLAHRLKPPKTFKITNKLDAYATNDFMGLNNNDQYIEEISKHADVTDDQKPRENFTNFDVTDADTDADISLNNDAKPKKCYYWKPR